MVELTNVEKEVVVWTRHKVTVSVVDVWLSVISGVHTVPEPVLSPLSVLDVGLLVVDDCVTDVIVAVDSLVLNVVLR